MKKNRVIAGDVPLVLVTQEVLVGVPAELVSLLIAAKQVPSTHTVVLEVGVYGELTIGVTLPVISS